jgi:hypothetical protein
VRATLPSPIPTGHVAVVVSAFTVSEQGHLSERKWITTLPSYETGQEPTFPNPIVNVQTRPGKRAVSFSDGSEATILEGRIVRFSDGTEAKITDA